MGRGSQRGRHVFLLPARKVDQSLWVCNEWCTDSHGNWGYGMAKRCAHCEGKLPLGVRFRNMWNGLSWVHLQFCSAKCERRYEQERRISNFQERWLSGVGGKARRSG